MKIEMKPANSIPEHAHTTLRKRSTQGRGRPWLVRIECASFLRGDSEFAMGACTACANEGVELLTIAVVTIALRSMGTLTAGSPNRKDCIR